MSAKKFGELPSKEVAMRTLLFVKQHAHGNAWTIAEIYRGLIERYPMSRANAYKLIRLALDVLCIDYSDNPERRAKISDAKASAIMRAWAEKRRRAA